MTVVPPHVFSPDRLLPFFLVVVVVSVPWAGASSGRSSFQVRFVVAGTAFGVTNGMLSFSISDLDISPSNAPLNTLGLLDLKAFAEVDSSTSSSSNSLTVPVAQLLTPLRMHVDLIVSALDCVALGPTPVGLFWYDTRRQAWVNATQSCLDLGFSVSEFFDCTAGVLEVSVCHFTTFGIFPASSLGE